MVMKGYFSIILHKTYVVGTHKNRLGEASLRSTHNISFYGEITKIIPKLSSNTLLICSTEEDILTLNEPLTTEYDHTYPSS